MRGKLLFDILRIAGKRKAAAVHARSRESGFSILEMVVVCAILMIIGSMVFVNGAKMVQGIRLNQSATSYANLLQEARIRAIRDDNFYSVLTTTGTDPTAYVDIGQSGSYALADPMMIFSQSVIKQAYSSGPGNSNLKAQFLPVGAPPNTVNTNAGGPTFGPRGLPCSPNGTTCPSLATPTAYITFFQNSVSSKWAAVTVTPAGRIQIWSYDGSTWNPQN